MKQLKLEDIIRMVQEGAKRVEGVSIVAGRVYSITAYYVPVSDIIRVDLKDETVDKLEMKE